MSTPMGVPATSVRFLGVFPFFPFEVCKFVKMATEKARLTRPFELSRNAHGFKSGAFVAFY